MWSIYDSFFVDGKESEIESQISSEFEFQNKRNLAKFDEDSIASNDSLEIPIEISSQRLTTTIEVANNENQFEESQSITFTDSLLPFEMSSGVWTDVGDDFEIASSEQSEENELNDAVEFSTNDSEYEEEDSTSTSQKISDENLLKIDQTS